MHFAIALLVGVLVAWAIRRDDGPDDLGHWRLLAAATGALYPYFDKALYLFGTGAYLQLGDALFWSIPLLPFHAVVASAALTLAMGRQVSFTTLYLPVIAGMAVTVFLGLLTDDGIAPLAPLWDGRFGFRVMYPFDAVVLGLSVLTLSLGFIFFPFRRYMARMGLACIALYMLSNAGLAWQARSFGWDYAEALEIADNNVKVHALPQPLSPLNWRVLVEERESGKVHDTLINLKRTAVVKLAPNPTRAARVDALYRPRAFAVWRVYDRFGTQGVEDDADRLRVERAYAAWMDTPFEWYGRYAIFDRLIPSPLEGFAATCVNFIDIRFEGARREDRGTYLICPAGRNGKARVFQPKGKDEWREIMAVVGVGNV